MGHRKAYNKDILRNIIVQKISWISIIMIAAIAAAAYFGISLTADALAANSDRYYKKLNMADLRVGSTLFFTEEDAKEIAALDGVKDTELSWKVNGFVKGKNDELMEVTVISLNERISLPIVVEGRLPENENECLIQTDIQNQSDYKLGDTIVVKGNGKDKPDFIKTGKYTVVGIMNHPDTIFSDVGTKNRYVIVPMAAFDTDNEFTKGCYTTVLVSVEHGDNFSYFSDDTVEETDKVAAEIEELAKVRQPLREAEIEKFIEDKDKSIADAEAKIADGKKKLEDGKKQLKDADKKLKNGKKELDDGRKKLDDVKKQLEDGKAQLDEGKKLLDYGWAKARDGKAQLDSGKAQLDSGKAQLKAAYDEIENAKNTIRNKMKEALGPMGAGINWSNGRPNPDIDSADVSAKTFYITEDYSVQLGTPMETIIKDFLKSRYSDEQLWEMYDKSGLPRPEGVDPADAITAMVMANPQVQNSQADYQKLSDGAAEWDRMHNEVYLPALYKYYAGLNEYNQGLATLNEKQAQYDSALAQYNYGLAQYEEGEKKYEDGVRQYNDALVKYDEGKKKLEDGEKEYNEKVAEYEEAKKSYDELKSLIKTIDGCRWVNESLKVNMDYLKTKLNVENFGVISYTFSALFILVAMVVIYATVGRIIDEQQKQVGSMKAFGFFETEIFNKYQMFSITSTIIGSILGIIAGSTLIQYIGVSQTFKYSNMGKNTLSFNWTAAIIFTVIFGIMSTLAVYLSCRKLLKKHATELLGGFAPVNGLSKSSGGGRGSLFTRLIWRNMWIDKKRVAITIISVAGATALLVIGFTVRYCINNSVKDQFSDITLYDMTLSIEDSTDEESREKIESILKECGTEYISVMRKNKAFMGSEDYDSATVIACNPDEIGRYYDLNMSGNNKTKIENGGIYVPRKTYEVLELSPGKDMTFYSDYMKSMTVPVKGYYTTYIDRFILCTDESYEEIFKEDAIHNSYLIYLNGYDAETLNGKLKDIPGFVSLQNFDSVKEHYMSYVRAFDFVMIILIIIAGMMVFFILNNLVNMYVNQKRREISIMRINGFTIREIERYLLNELIVTISAGIILGVGIGVAFGGYIAYMLEQPMFMLVRTPQIMAILIGIVITAIFSAIVLYFAVRRAKHFKLTDAMD